ncbi:hypothetical protein [Geoglobus acetivorans]|uniref:Peptidase S54 rhomboid domain-containing protein n=1 Tax=Geoglobus acetivorans TaxID=565033 RepID=A0A0A7GB26_GEOAI|nr:hypothetical protein GACE_0178 [Geoglobus acetivorans]
MRFRKFLPDALILLLPALACLALFYLPTEVRNMLTLNTENYSIMLLYTTNFIHYEWGHLAGNLAYYLAFGFASLLLYSRLGYRRVYRYSLPLILVLVPVLSSAYSLWAVKNCGGSGRIYGFSDVTGAVIGMFGYGGALLISLDKKDAPCSYLFLMLITLYYFVSTYLGLLSVFSMGLLFIAILPFYMIAIRHAGNREEKKRMVAGFGLAMLYLFSLSAMFPENLASNGKAVNILGHLMGVLLGVTIPFLLVNTSDRFAGVHDPSGHAEK